MAIEMVDSMKFGADYQVFLSFRGPDTRKGFTDCLYHFLTSAGIRVFKDDEDQPLGEKIEKILDAINNSTLCIPIFSRGYASSKWCLRELAKMVKLGKKIIPIFYDVTPDDVKLKTSLYVDALMKHEKSSTKEDVALELEKWKEALAKVGTFTGRELRDTGYGEFSQSIVNEVLIKLKTKQKLFSSQLVGMEEQVEALTKLLEVKSSDIRFVGIHGMGGIGKTTLAKLVFNHLSSHFECCSFLSDVRELSKGNPEQLYKQLLVDIRSKLGVLGDRESMIKTIRDVIHNKKVLIVLDDVDEKEKIKEFARIFCGTGSGSRIIITTRDKSILAEVKEKVREFEMKEMNFYRALQLFSRHAFNEDYPPSDYLDLSKEMVSVVGRLPLSLEIIGSHLRGKCKEVWKENMRAFARIPHKDVQKQLRISFESLDYREKQIFLDIACFFANKEKATVFYMWDACDFHPVSTLDNLISMSMVKIVDDNKLWMHDQLRALGREIVCMENFTDLGRRSRLWSHKEGIGMLKRGEGTRKVEALRMSYDYHSPGFSFTPVGFKKMRNLRILECHGVGLVGDFQDVLTKLIWLSWHFCPTDFKDTEMNLESLAILELCGSMIDENWYGWSNMKIGDNLKVLDLAGCVNLKRAPDISKYKRLERLILEDCSDLVEIGHSIGKLESLKYLNATGCSSLRSFPAELGNLSSLEVIIMEGNGQNFTLPKSIGNLTSLKVLEIVRVEILGLPWSIGNIVNLLRVSLHGCTGIKVLPYSFGELTSLVELNLSEASIAILPDSIGHLNSLNKLNLSKSGISKLPQSIGNLEVLKVLKIEKTSIKELPSTVGGMKNLEELHARGSALEEIPREIEMLICLRILDLSSTNIRSMPSISRLTLLHTLLLEDCLQLRLLSELPTSLITLHMCFSLLWILPNLSKCDQLVDLQLHDGTLDIFSCKLLASSLVWIGKLTKLITLELCLSSITNVSTDFRACCQLKALAIGFPEVDYPAPQLPPTLTRLCLKFVDTRTKLPCLSHLKELSYLELQHCSIENGVESLEIGELGSLRHFHMQFCDFRELEDLSLPENLEVLCIDKCKFLKTLPNLSRFQNLRSFVLRESEEIKEIIGLGSLKTLSNLEICHCKSLEKLDHPSTLNLKDMYVGDCEKLKDYPIGFCTRLILPRPVQEGYLRRRDYGKGG